MHDCDHTNLYRTELHLAYLSGPVDALEVYKSWSSGGQLDYFGASHVSDFFKVCSDLGAKGYVITTLAGSRSRQRFGRFLIENRPMPSGLKGIVYHLAHMLWLASTIPAVVRFRPHIFVITAGQNYWFLLFILKWFDIKIIPALTCTLFPKFYPARTSWRILLALNAIFLSQCTTAVMTASEDIARQVHNILRGNKIPIVTFLPIYLRSQFSIFRSANFYARPFMVFFAGRIETNKGVYDLVKIAKTLCERSPQGFHFDVCGDGSELKNLRKHIVDQGLTRVINCHGFCDRSKLSILLQESHVVIVPTTTQFEEGFNMVCAESILAGRPVITSAVCPALEYVGEAAIEVPPDDVSAYCEAIMNLANDRELYERKLASCKPLQGLFYDASNSWGAKLREVLDWHLSAGSA